MNVMKKILLLLFLAASLWNCQGTDDDIDGTFVPPPPTPKKIIGTTWSYVQLEESLYANTLHVHFLSETELKVSHIEFDNWVELSRKDFSGTYRYEYDEKNVWENRLTINVNGKEYITHFRSSYFFYKLEDGTCMEFTWGILDI